jgi:methylphosphotriester-DNA--protein-cysteine methyltransferase
VKQYKILKNGQTILSDVPGTYAGWKPGKIFGRLTCKSGMKMRKESRVFFLTFADAVYEGYMPCKKCNPLP